MPETGRRLGRTVGALLITEGALVAILRFLSLVYALAGEAYNADRFRTPLPHFLPSVLIAIAVSLVLVWAGSFLRREPSGAWTGVGPAGRIVLVAACLLNVAAFASAVWGLVGTPSTVEATLTWCVVAGASLVVIAGLARDVLRRADT